MSAPFLPSLVGATASGKTSVAIEAARVAGAEILSADSRQVYEGLRIGTAMPTDEERAAVPHHLVDFVPPTEIYSAARFGRDARAAAEDVRGRGRIPFLVGGSGLYLRATEEGLFEGPEADPELRAEYETWADEHGNEALLARLAEVDPDSAARLPPADRKRVVRALEVHTLTGIAMTEHHRIHRESRPPLRTLRFGIEWGPEPVARRIARRIDQMLRAGWTDEVRDLLAAGVPADAPAFDALGYPEILAHVRGEIELGEAKERIVIATRRFAKRQRTWFRRVADVTCFRASRAADLEGVGRQIGEAIAQAAGEEEGGG